MLQNLTTTLIDDTNLFMKLYSSCLVSIESLLNIISVGILFVMIAWQERAQSDYIRSNVKQINVPELHHYSKFSMMFCFGGFRYNACIRSQKESTKHDIACIFHTIQSSLQLFLFDIAPNLLNLHTPQWNNPSN